MSESRREMSTLPRDLNKFRKEVKERPKRKDPQQRGIWAKRTCSPSKKESFNSAPNSPTKSPLHVR